MGEVWGHNPLLLSSGLIQTPHLLDTQKMSFWGCGVVGQMHSTVGEAARMQPNCGGESARGCREESMLTKGLSAKGEGKWVHIHAGNK